MGGRDCLKPSHTMSTKQAHVSARSGCQALPPVFDAYVIKILEALTGCQFGMGRKGLAPGLV